jgi:predicted phosphodiesterase
VDRIALISDIHGNIPALDATLDDIARRGITRIFCLGDLVGKGPCSEAVVDICRDRCERVIRGNWDEALAGTIWENNPTAQWHQARLGPERLTYLRELPNTIDFVLSGKRVRLVHASPTGVFHRVFPDAPRERLLAMFDSTEFTGPGFDPDVVGYGDIHAGYLLSFRQKILFNVGSVGNPLDLTQACYAILEGSAGGVAPLAINLVRVPYDIERAVREATAEQMPDLAPYVNELRTARYRGRPAKPDPNEQGG